MPDRFDMSDQLQHVDQRVEGGQGAPPRLEHAVPLEVQFLPRVHMRREAEQDLLLRAPEAEGRVQEVPGAVLVVRRPQLADQFVLEQQGLAFRIPRHDLEGARLADQRPHLAVHLAARGVPVLLEAAPDVPGLADVQHGTLLVLEQVDRRRHGRFFDEALAEFAVELAHGGRIYNVSTCIYVACMPDDSYNIPLYSTSASQIPHTLRISRSPTGEARP